MPIVFSPLDFLSDIAPKFLVKQLVTKDLTLNRTVLSMLARTGFMSKKTLEDVALKVIRQYKSSYKAEIADGASAVEALDEVLNGKRLMVQRVQNAIVSEVSQEIKNSYAGDFFIWLPSTANEPDPLHQLNYGKKFRIRTALELPGERFGCQCGMKILVPGTELDL